MICIHTVALLLVVLSSCSAAYAKKKYQKKGYIKNAKNVWTTINQWFSSSARLVMELKINAQTAFSEWNRIIKITFELNKRRRLIKERKTQTSCLLIPISQMQLRISPAKPNYSRLVLVMIITALYCINYQQV